MRCFATMKSGVSRTLMGNSTWIDTGQQGSVVIIIWRLIIRGDYAYALMQKCLPCIFPV